MAREEARVDEAFRACIRYLNTSTCVDLQDHDRLRLYGFYKQATCAVRDEEADYIAAMRKERNLKIARAKWQAWAEVRKQGLTPTQAKLAYVSYVDKLAAAAKLPDWRSSVGFELEDTHTTLGLAQAEAQAEGYASEGDLVSLLRARQEAVVSEERRGGSAGEYYSGYLLKKHQVEAIWELKFFVLDDNILSFYGEDTKNGAPTCPHGVVYLYDCEVKALGEAHLSEASSDCFYLVGILHAPSKKHYFLGAASKALAEAWVSRLQRAVAVLTLKYNQLAQEPISAPEQEEFARPTVSR